MLETLRQGAQTLVAKVLFGLLIVSFGIWGIADVFRGGGGGALATVGGTPIPVEDFRRGFRNELQRFSREAKTNITPEQGKALGIDQRVLSQLIGGAAIEHHATELGLGASDATLVDGIKSDPDFFGPDGKFSETQFRAILQQIGLSEQGFLTLRRKDNVKEQIVGSFVNSVVVPKTLIDLEHAYKNEKRIVEWQTIDAQKMIAVADPDDAKINELYEAGKNQYMTPEYRKFDYLTIQTADLKKLVTVSDEEVTKSYEETKESYNVPEQRRVQQVSFKTKAAADAAKRSLESNDKSFGDVAKESGAKDSDTDLGLVTKKRLIDPKVAEAVFALPKDRASDVIEGRFAFVIARVTQIEPGVTKTFDDVKGDVLDKLATAKAASLLKDKKVEVEDARSAGKSLKDIAETMKLQYLQVAAIDRKGLDPTGKPALTSPDAQKIATQVFAPDVGSDEQSIDLADGGSAWVNLVSTEAPKQKPLDEVKDEIKNRFIASERTRLAAELATKLSERINAGEAMQTMEALTGGKTERTEAITRSTQPQGVSAFAVAQAFNLQKGRAGHAPTDDKSSQTIFRVTDVVPAAEITLTQKESVTAELAGDLTNQVLAEYVEGLKKRLGASVNERQLKTALGLSEQ